MKIKKTDLNLLIMVIGVLIAVAAYFFVFTSFNEKTAAVEGKNATLQTEVDELQKLADNKEMYISETARMNDEINETIDRFPAGIMPEDILMYVYSLENTESVYFTSIAMEQAQLVTVADASADAATGDAVVEDAAVTEETSGDAVVATGGMKDTVFLYTTPITYGFKSTYRSIKDIMAGIVEGQDRMNIQSITLSYDGETGCVTGTVATNAYTMSGTGKYYELLDITGVPTGVDDLFKSNPVLNIHTGNNDYEGEEADLADGASEDETSEDEETEEGDKPVSEED